jgi:bifunctional UDP-N-acetylglucosamine pyrophosphorylase/glucosamine-1-phosphate N-acetyltransferase
MSDINVIILAGGVSSRFWPLNEKNIYTFFGHTPFDYHIERLKNLKPKKIIIVTNENIKVNYPNTESVIQKGSGMAGAVKTGLELIDQDEELLIMAANDYYDESLFELLQDKRESLSKNNQSAMAACKVSSYFPGGYLKLNGNKILGIIEKPDADKLPSSYVNMVFHYFHKAGILFEALKSASSDKDDVYEVALDNLIGEGIVFQMIEYTGNWKSIKYPWQVLDVMNLFLSQIKGQNVSSDAQISDKATIKGDVVIESGAKVFEGAVINGPSYIGKNTIIANGALVRGSMIGNDCVIGYETEVARSYLKSQVWLHKNYVGDSVFESNISLGSGTVTGNLRLDEQKISMEVKGKKVDTGRNKLGAIIGSNVRIGINTSIMPGIRVGSNSFVGPHVLLTKDVPENSFVKSVSSYKITKNKFDITNTSRENIKKNL